MDGQHDGAVLVRGAPIAEGIRAEIRQAAVRHSEAGLHPRMAVVVASDDPAAHQYAGAKVKRAADLGIAIELVEVAPGHGQDALSSRLRSLSADPTIHGILLELPLAQGLEAERAIEAIAPLKDVDGMTAANMGLVAIGREAEAIVPATPLACIRLAESVTSLKGRRAVVVGRGRTVGRALAPMLVNRDATVTVCHSRTVDLAGTIAAAEIVFVAAGRAGLVRADMVRPGQVVIDAGINVEDGRTIGDVDPAAQAVVAAMTPVPGGVGPVTSTLVFANLMRAIGLQASGRRGD